MGRKMTNKTPENNKIIVGRAGINGKILTANEIKNRLRTNSWLTNCAKPYIEKMYTFAEESSIIIFLTDSEGCILKIVTNEELQKKLTEKFIISGSFPPPKTALYLAIDKVVATQFEANTEHGDPLAELKPNQWKCHATPLQIGAGQLAGTLSIYFSEKLNAKMLYALLNLTANCIKHELQYSEEKEQVQLLKEIQLNQLNMYAQPNFVVNAKGIIKVISDEACNILGSDRENIIGKKISKFIPEWQNITTKDGKWIEVEHKEVLLQNASSSGLFLLKTKAIMRTQNKFDEQICSLQNMRHVLNEANKYIGNTAHVQLNDIMGISVTIKRLIKEAKAIAKTDNAVMLIGEKHTGCESIAQAIHNASARITYGFVKVNVANLSPEELEETLWGYHENFRPHLHRIPKPGAFEFANGGTLYISNIGLMPISTQEKVFEAIKTKKVTRLGSAQQITVDVRIMCSNPFDLSDKIERKEFKIDLFYSLSTSSVRMPALRERRADIPLLINHYITLKSEELGLNPVNIPRKIVLILRRYEWPGNFKEMIELSERIIRDKGRMFKTFKNERDFKSKNLYLDQLKEIENLASLEENEKELIVKAYKAYKGSISKTSRRLGISRNTLYLKLRKYGVDI